GMGWARIGGVRQGKWKFTAEPNPVELYDVLTDPEESTNHAAHEAEVTERLRGLYEERQVPVEQMTAGGTAVSPEARERLAALGYVSMPQQFAPGEVPDPRHGVLITGWIDRAMVVALEGRVPQAIQALEIFARESVVARPYALQRLAPLYLLVERQAEAIAAFEAVAAIVGTPDARIDVAEALTGARRAPDALRVLDEVQQSWPSPTAKFYRARARALLGVGRFDEAEKDAAVILERAPADDGALALRSQARAARDGADAEIARLREILRAAPDPSGLGETTHLLAKLLHGRGRDTEAIEVLDGAASKPAESRALLAEILAARGGLDKAAELYEAVVAERPAVVRHGRELASVYERLGRLAKALETYERMIALNSKDAALFVDRGALLLRMGKKNDAEADFRKAITLDEKLPEANLDLAVVLLGDGRRDEAEKLLLRALEARPDYAKAHFHLARAYREAGDPRAALHAEKAAASSNVQSRRAREALGDKNSR
ncbi:MAG: tetratricopeptide repeat protein, partial [Candidatus Binatia bacterium]